MTDRCQYDVAPSSTTICQPCGARTGDGVYCGVHIEWVRDNATNPEFVRWWQEEAAKAARISEADGSPYET